MSIELQGTYGAATPKYFPVGSVHRVIFLVHPESADDPGIAVVIRIDESPLHRPTITTYREFDQLIFNKELRPRVTKANPLHRLTDAQLRKRFPPINRRPDRLTGARKEESSAVEYRRKWLAVVDDITPKLESVWRKQTSLAAILEPVLSKHKVPLNETLQVLYRFLANGSNRKSVISDRILCGGKGKKRTGKGFHLGRKKTEIAEANLANNNFSLDDDWIAKCVDIAEDTIERGVTAGKAYQTFLNTHCVTSVEFVDGELKVEYLEPTQCPSKRQFLINCTQGDKTKTISRLQGLPNEFEKNLRALDGNRFEKTFRTGVLALVDASSNDRYLRSVWNRNKVVGTARFIPVVEEGVGYIWGFYLGWTVNGEVAKLAALHAASMKAPYCARYGITIRPNQWYHCLHASYRADKGEFNAKEPRIALENLNRSIEFVQTNRPDLRGGGEQTNSRMHDHDAPGSTFGTFRRRGQKDPAAGASQDIFQYTRELIRKVLYLNNEAPADHLLTSEMRQQGVKGTRKDIIEFSMRNGYHHQIAYDDDDLITDLAPIFDAVVKEDGVFPIVRRHGDLGDEILLNELRFLGDYPRDRQWLERARRNGRFRVQIQMNPNAPDRAYYHDPDEGLQTLELATQDPLLRSIATVQDIVASHTLGAGDRRKLNDNADRAAAKMHLENQADREENKRQDAEANKERPLTPKGSNGEGRRKNKQNEIATTGQSPMPVQLNGGFELAQTNPSAAGANDNALGDLHDDIDSVVDAWLNDAPR